MATHSNILGWEIPWTEKPGGLQSMEWQSVGYDLAHSTHTRYFMTSLACLLLIKYHKHTL